MTLSNMERRHFLKAGAALGALGAAAPLAGQLATLSSASAQGATNYKALVCIFLFGGNDAHNMVLATDTDSWGRYLSARNTGSDPIALLPPGAAAQAAGSASIHAPGGRTVTRATPEFWGGVLPIVPDTANPIPAGTNVTGARTFGIHPLMAPLMPMWNAGRLGVVANAGPLIVPTTKTQYRNRTVPLPANLQSHNDQQAIWMAGAAEGARRGWGGLMADTMLGGNGTNSVFTAISPAGNQVFLAGDTVVQYQISTSLTSPGIRINGTNTGGSIYGSQVAGQKLTEIIRDNAGPNYFTMDHANVVRRSMDSSATLNTALSSAPATTIPAPSPFTNPISGNVESNSLATQMQSVARMIASGQGLGLTRQVFFVSLGGWDTHDRQNPDQGAQLARVAHAMAYLDGALSNVGGVDMRNNVTAFTASDFSRTFNTNGDGTDHAWGGHQFIMGGAVRGRNMYGQYPTLGVDQGSFNNPDMQGNTQIPTSSVDQMGATLGRWLGVSDSNLGTIFPNLRNFNAASMGFMM
jgi:uncharacterized protein (DUF1501 family)